jgi:uncharacterized protein (DUF4415 family)
MTKKASMKRTLDLHKLPQLTADQKARLNTVASMPDELIDYSDAPHLPDVAWVKAGGPPTSKKITLRKHIVDTADSNTLPTPNGPIQIVFPDAGPFVSLAGGEVGGALDLLLNSKEEVRIVITDVAEFELARQASDSQAARAAQAFIARHPNRVEVVPTTIGALALADWQHRQHQAKQDGRGVETGAFTLAPDIGELSVAGYVISLRKTNPGVPILIIVDDEWLAANSFALPDNARLCSTSTWLDGLAQVSRVVE